MKTSSGFRMLLLELVCNLAIFVLCAVVCVALFLKADALSRQSTELTHGVYLAQSAAELWKSGIQPASLSGDYQIILEPAAGENGLKRCDITIMKEKQVVYTLKGVTTFE